MSQELVDSIVDAMPLVDDCAYIVDNSILFREMTLKEWSKEIQLPLLHDKMSYTDIQAYNYEFVRVNDIVMLNLGFAKAYNVMAIGNYNNALKAAQNKAIVEINADRTKKMPGADTLEKMASLHCTKEAMAQQLTSVFYEFWKIHADKMKTLESRLQNINYMVRN